MDKKIAAPQEKGDHLSTTAELNCTIKVGSSGKFVGKKQPGVTGTQPKAS